MYNPTLDEIAKKLGYSCAAGFRLDIQKGWYPWATFRRTPKGCEYHIDYDQFQKRFWKGERLMGVPV